MSGSMSLQKYLSVFNIGLQNTFVYRWNYFLRALFGLIPLAGTVFLWSAVFKERGGGLHGYDYSSMIYYYLLTILVSNLVVPTEDEWQISADIREGQINALLTTPTSYLARLRGPDLVQALALQAGWLLVAWMWARFMWQRGLGHYQAVGG